MTMYKPKEMAEKLGVTVRTLQKWDCSGKLPAYRTPTNRRYYTEEQYLAYIGADRAKDRKVVAYARVSTRNQKDDLKNQVQFIQTFANGKGIILDETIEDFGSGLDYKRKKWLELLEAVDRNEIGTIFVTYKDRFIRFGYDYFEHFCRNHQTKLIALNNKESSPVQELIDDLVSIIHVFSSRLYGLRKYQSKIKEDQSLKAGDGDGSH